MKRLICILIFASCCVACSDDGDTCEPVIEGHSIFRADVETLTFLGGSDFEHIWLKGENIGVYGSLQGENNEFILKRDYYDRTGEAEFYGPKVKGDVIMAYWPYDAAAEARIGAFPMTVSSEQVRCENPYEQFLETSRLFARYDMYGDGKLHFEYPLGAIAVEIDYAVTVKKVILSSETRKLSGRGYVDENMTFAIASNGSNSITLDCGDGIVSTPEAKERFHIMLPAGEYAERELTLTIEAVPASDSFSYKMKPITVGRVSVAENNIVSVRIGSDLPDFGFEPNPLD